MKRILYLQTHRALTGFSEACLSLTPEIAFYPNPWCEEGDLYLELSSTLRIFKSEERQLETFGMLCENFGWQGRWTLCDRAEWARPLTLESFNVFAPGKSEAAFRALPIARMMECGDPLSLESTQRAREKLVHFLKQVGICTVGDFVRLPPETIHHRFGVLGHDLSMWSRGEKPWVTAPLRPEPALSEEIDAEETDSLEMLLFSMRKALVRLEARLRARQLCAQEIFFLFRLASRDELPKKLVLSEPLRDAQSLLRLLRDFLDGFTWDSPLQKLTIQILRTERFVPGQLDLFDGGEVRRSELAFYVTRLRILLGEKAAGVASPQASYLPERSWSYQDFSPKTQRSPPTSVRTPHRPLFLFSTPRPCRVTPEWKLKLAEKISAEWWVAGGQRSYYFARSPRGERYWIYRDEESQQWFIHGTFD